MTAPTDARTDDVIPKHPRAAEVLEARYPSFRDPLLVARKWNRSGDPDDLAAAAALLDGLTARYPTVLVVWYELALNRISAAGRKAALIRLSAIHDRFGGRLDEDTFCLWGRCYKDAGHKYLADGLALPPDAFAARPVPEREPVSPLVQSGNAAAADREYELACQRYEQGYALSGGWFPQVNVAFLTFMRAALAKQMGRPDDAQRLLDTAQARAAAVLDRTEWVRKLPDDDVWHEASRGEAHALRYEWAVAVEHYRRAAALPNAQPEHRKSMGKQLAWVFRGWELLARPAPADVVKELSALFSPSPVTP